MVRPGGEETGNVPGQGGGGNRDGEEVGEVSSLAMAHSCLLQTATFPSLDICHHNRLHMSENTLGGQRAYLEVSTNV